MKFINTLKGENTKVPPIWIMRQAGRYLPEYRNIRQTADNFIAFCLDSEKASEVTLQPISRYGFDAAIIFSDILLVPWAMKRNVQFIPGTGPKLVTYAENPEIYQPDSVELETLYAPVSKAIALTREKLDAETALIGFSGAPWTLLTYMVEGGSSRDFAESRQLIYSDLKQCRYIIDMLVEQIVAFLALQAKAGADVLMLFDSWSGAVPAEFRTELVIAPHKKIIESLRQQNIHQPVIAFPKGLGEGLIDYTNAVDIDAVALDHMTDIGWAHSNIRPELTFQGNIDPLSLVAGGQQMRNSIDSVLDIMQDRPHIFNLGHGVVPHTPPEHVAELVDYVRAR